MAERNAFLVSGSGTTMIEMVKAAQAGETPVRSIPYSTFLVKREDSTENARFTVSSSK